MEDIIFENEYFKSVIGKVFLIKKLFHNQCQQATKNVHITKEQCFLLHMIEEGKLTQSEIAKQMHISNATLSVRIKRLEEAGYIKRSLSSSDHRKYTLEITEQGLMELEKAALAIDGLTRKMIDSLTVEDYEHFIRIADIITQNLQEEE